MCQNTSNSVWKPCEDLQQPFDLCHCQQRVYNKVLRETFVIDQILIFHHNLQINSLKILQWDFLDSFSHFVCHSWSVPMMKITGLSHLFKWENLHNWWLTKYFFPPLYVLESTVAVYTCYSAPLLFIPCNIITTCVFQTVQHNARMDVWFVRLGPSWLSSYRKCLGSALMIVERLANTFLVSRHGLYLKKSLKLQKLNHYQSNFSMLIYSNSVCF